MIQKRTPWILLGTCLALTVLGSAYAYRQRPFQIVLGSFLTDLSARTPAQQKNIRRVAAQIHQTILQPGELFSFNLKAGPYTEERGYLPERSFRGSQVTESFGGGICQVSSTLYNAAQIAQLPILERVQHKLPVQSVPPGMDATVAYGIADLKFKNSYPFPIQLTTRIEQNQLQIEIWGKEKLHVE